MNYQQLSYLKDLIDREIENFKSVKDRVNKKEDWDLKIADLVALKKDLEQLFVYNILNKMRRKR